LNKAIKSTILIVTSTRYLLINLINFLFNLLPFTTTMSATPTTDLSKLLAQRAAASSASADDGFSDQDKGSIKSSDTDLGFELLVAKKESVMESTGGGG
jgi:hypothetical protein